MGNIEVYCDRCGETVRGRCMPDTTWEERVDMVNLMRETHERMCANRPPEYSVVPIPNGDGLTIEVYAGEDDRMTFEFRLEWDQVDDLILELEGEVEANRLRGASR